MKKQKKYKPKKKKKRGGSRKIPAQIKGFVNEETQFNADLRKYAGS